MAEAPKKRESLKEAVEGFERDRALREFVENARREDYSTEALMIEARRQIRERTTLRRDDVLDLLTAANDARQLAIASPKLAEQALAQATRLSDLAERIAMLLEGGE